MSLEQIRLNAEKQFPHENTRIKALSELSGGTEQFQDGWMSAKSITRAYAHGNEAVADRAALLRVADAVLAIHAAETNEGRTYCIECIGIDGAMENYPCRTASVILGTDGDRQ